MENKETARLEMFSDGVFAIAITLLVLEIKVPHIAAIHSNADLWRELGHLWPSYFAFILSFGFILVAWICHHALFNFLHEISPQLVYANGFLLLNVVFLPFPTAMLAEYIISDYRQPAIVFYCLTLFLTGIGWNLLYYFTLYPKPLVKEKSLIEAVRTMQKNSLLGLVVNLVLTAFAWWFPLIALGISTLLWFLWIKEGAAMLRNNKKI